MGESALMDGKTALRREGKPAYTQADLQRITAGDLRARLERIDNRQAHAIAAKLWKAVELQYTNQYGQLMLKDSHTLLRMAGNSLRHRLLARLEALRRVDFGDIVVEGPPRMELMIANLHPFVRFLHPPLRLKKTEDSAAHLLRYLEFIENPEQSVPESFRRSWLFVGGMFGFLIMPMLMLVLFIDRVREAKWLLIVGFAVMLGGVILSGFQLAGFGRLRTISLYISFTDEFVNLDEEQEMESGEQGDAEA